MYGKKDISKLITIIDGELSIKYEWKEKNEH